MNAVRAARRGAIPVRGAVARLRFCSCRPASLAVTGTPVDAPDRARGPGGAGRRLRPVARHPARQRYLDGRSRGHGEAPPRARARALQQDPVLRRSRRSPARHQLRFHARVRGAPESQPGARRSARARGLRAGASRPAAALACPRPRRRRRREPDRHAAAQRAGGLRHARRARRAGTLVTGPGAPPLRSTRRPCRARGLRQQATSYYEHLQALSARLRARGLPAIRVREAPGHFETEDVLEMANAGLAPLVVADSYLAKFWAQVFRASASARTSC